jgi:hypothetical protein
MDANLKTELQREGRGRAIRFLRALGGVLNAMPAPDHVGLMLAEKARERKRKGSIEIQAQVVEVEGRKLLNDEEKEERT